MVARITLAASLAGALLAAGCGDSAPTKLDCSTNPAGCICTDDTNCGGENPRCDNHTGRCVPCLMFSDNCTGGTRCLFDGNKYYCAMGCLKTTDCPKAVNGAQQQCCAGACVDITTSTANCGACGTACKDAANTTMACVGGGCVVGSCAAGFANCDNNPQNGCEANTNADPKHCGACGMACAVGANATATCSSGKCTATCVQGFADCDGNLQNGCEVDTTRDSKNCGACGTTCGPLMNSMNSMCVGSRCVPTACSGWFGDCDRDSANGCESDTQSDVKNCGACGSACPPPANGSNACTFGVCTIGKCNAGFGDCDQMVKTGCEKNLTADVRNCGGCGIVCAGSNSMQDCQGGACVITACAGGGFTDCNKDVKDGCEVNTNSDIDNCNGCGMACSRYANADTLCKLGVCAMGACKVGYSDCNKDINDGCEADLNGIQNCGGCGITCQVFANASNQCLGGKCTIKTCNQGFENCNNNINDGCEINLQTDPKNCGICGSACVYKNAAGACNAGKCGMGMCNAGFADCNKNDMDGCEQNIFDDPKNCGGCGMVCPQNAPNCFNSKCTNSIHLTKPWAGFNQFGSWGCLPRPNGNYLDDLNWIQTGSTDWKSCLLDASKYGAAMMAPYTGDWSYPGWFGHRNAGNACIGDPFSYNSASIKDAWPCVLVRPRWIMNRGGALKNAISYDGNSWNYEDYGVRYFYECQEFAANAGGSIISPYTIGQGNGDDYWIGIFDVCSTTGWVTGGGNSADFEDVWEPDPGSKHKCMVGYIDN